MTAIAIDGPAGAGKSTIAKLLAQELGFIYVDTGALYRAIGLYVTRQGVDPKNAAAVEPLLGDIALELRYVDGDQRVMLCGEDVSDAIRLPAMSMAASDVSAIPAVRAFLLDRQKEIACHNHVVMDGRDIGTVILPDAQIKIFLTATAEDRAERRRNQLLKKGIEADYDEILRDVKERDYNDSHRAIAPLKQASDAFLIDTTGNTLEKTTNLILQFVKERLP